MKKITALTFVLICFLGSFAQFPAAAPGKAGQQAPANIGHIYGKVVDTAGKPLSDVSIMLLQNKFDTITKKRKEILLKGIITKSNGEFSFSELPMFGPLKLKISATGYTAFEQTVSFQMKADNAPVQKGSNADPAQQMASNEQRPQCI